MIRKISTRMSAAPPISTFKLVLLRTTTILSLLGATLLMTIAIISRPWKTEFYGANMEIGLFHACLVHYFKGARCFTGVHEANPTAWFMTFRTFLLISTFSGLFAAVYAIAQLIRTTTEALNVFLIPAILSLISGCLSLTSLLMLVGYWEFRHLDDFRMYKIGWKKYQITKDFMNWPNNMAWVACVMFIFNFFLCIYAHFKDTSFMNALEFVKEKDERDRKDYFQFFRKNIRFRKKAILSLIYGNLSLTSLLMLVGYWEFRHMDDFRMYKIGWKKYQITKDFMN